MSELVFRRSKGQSLMEYALLFALITGVVIVTIILLGPQLASEYKMISNAL
jgi:Flp pilus assembly pilin Flp